MERSKFVPTSIAVEMTARLRATHKRHGISVFSGPPGLGKTTAIEQFAAEFPGEVVIIKISTQGVRECAVLQHAIEAMSQVMRSFGGGRYTGNIEARYGLAESIRAWHFQLESENVALRGKSPPPLTFVFDEAQNLSRNAIEGLRYWNDEDRCYGPFPIGLVFVGNNEFALAQDKHGNSALSAAVTDRALCIMPYDYSHLSNDDIRLFLAAHDIADAGAANAIVKHFSTPRQTRSLRRILRLAEEIKDEAAGLPVTANHVWSVLTPA